MQENNELVNYYDLFEKMQQWMINDLRNACIKGQANLLVGMGIFNYIEILGSFYHFQNKKGNNKRRFDYVFNELMGIQYNNIYHKLNDLTKGAYDVLRCGLTHEYLIKTYKMKEKNQSMKFTIFGVNDLSQYTQNIMSTDCGIELITLNNEEFHLRIYNPRLIYDLNLAFERYKSYIRSDSSNSFGSYREKFLKRCTNINFKDFN